LDSSIPYQGEILAIGTAVAWAWAVMFFKKSGETVHPIALNVFKNILAGILFLPTIYIFGQSLFYGASWQDYAMLLLSGALGIGIADTCFFKSLNILGAGLTAIVDCLYAPSIILFAILILGEKMEPRQILGTILIISAVLTAAHKKGRGPLDHRSFLKGLAWGTIGMITMGVGIVMVKPILERSPLLWVTEIRILGGLLVLAVVLLFHRQRGAILASALHKDGRRHTFWGAFLGTYLALIMWLGGMKYTQASIAAALNQTSNIFIFIFAALILKEPLNRLKITGIILAMVGAFLVIS